jgi:hypothetical protein
MSWVYITIGVANLPALLAAIALLTDGPRRWERERKREYREWLQEHQQQHDCWEERNR